MIESLNVYSPQQITLRVEQAGIAKANLPAFSTFILAVMAGSFIAFGSVLCTFVANDHTMPDSVNKLLCGLVFCIGLVLVVIAGAELFTGNCLLSMPASSRSIKIRALLKNWLIVYVGNFVGAFAVALLIWQSGHWNTNNLAQTAFDVGVAKVSAPFFQLLVKGILANIFVCLGVWLCFACRSVTDKIVAIIFPITAFVALGFEHSIANMYFIPAAILIKNSPQLFQTITQTGAENLTWQSFIVINLIPVTIGNILGGAVFIGLPYWLVYSRNSDNFSSVPITQAIRETEKVAE